MPKFKYDLGSEMKSRVSGFRGMVISRAECLYGCDRYFIQPKVNKENKQHDGCWFDEAELEFINGPKVKKDESTRNKGGWSSPIR